MDIARGLTALHAVNVVHRDLKSKNVLLTSELDAKIGDVGIAAVKRKPGTSPLVLGRWLARWPGVLPSCFWANGVLRRLIFTVSVSFCGKLPPATSSKRIYTLPVAFNSLPGKLITLIEDCTDEDPRNALVPSKCMTEFWPIHRYLKSNSISLPSLPPSQIKNFQTERNTNFEPFITKLGLKR